jgi:hypothetical protein
MVSQNNHRTHCSSPLSSAISFNKTLNAHPIATVCLQDSQQGHGCGAKAEERLRADSGCGVDRVLSGSRDGSRRADAGCRRARSGARARAAARARSRATSRSRAGAGGAGALARAEVLGGFGGEGSESLHGLLARGGTGSSSVNSLRIEESDRRTR